MSPLRNKSISRSKKVDSLGHSVFYPSTTQPTRRPSQSRHSVSTSISSTAPSTPPAPSPQRLTLPSKPAPTFYIADMSLPGTPGRTYGEPVDPISPIDMTEFPFPPSSSSSLTTSHLANQSQYLPSSPHSLSTMIEKWNLATPPNYPPPRKESSAFGIPASESSNSISTVGTELRSPPELPSSQGFHSRVLPTDESPAQILRASFAHTLPKPPRRSSDSPVARSPYSPATSRPAVITGRDSPDLTQSPSSRSPAPVPFRQPSWSDARRGSVPADRLGIQHTPQQNPLFYPPAALYSPPPLTTSSPLTFVNLDAGEDIPPRTMASPMGYDLFTPGYNMGGPSIATPPANTLELNLGPIFPTQPRQSGFGSFSTPSALPPHTAEETGTSFGSEATDVSECDPAASTVAAKHLKNHILPLEFLQRYMLADELGSGGFGFVCSANMTGRGNEMGREVAVKFIFKERLEKTKDALVDGEPMESWVLRGCNHPNIIAWIDLFEDEQFFIMVQELHGDPWSNDHTLHQAHPEPHTDPGRRLSLLQTPSYRSPSPLISPISPLRPFEANPFDLHMTNPDGTVSRPRMGRRASHDLFEAVESIRFTEEEAKWIFKQIVSGVSYLHSKGIYHRDLKDENIVIDRYLNVKIIDFGSAVAEDHLQAPNLYGSFRGTYSYASPEVIQGSWYHAAPCDIWSIGIILSILLTGEQPFPDKAHSVAGRFKLKKPTSEGARDLMEKMFRPDPTRRWGIEKVEKHRWLRSVRRPKHLPTPPGEEMPSGGKRSGSGSRGLKAMWDGMAAAVGGGSSSAGSMGPPPPPMADGAYRFGALPPLPTQSTSTPVRKKRGSA